MSREGRARWGFNQRFVIGKQDNPMMERWRLIQTPWFGIYVHFVYREDLDTCPHDHPWTFIRMVLRGGYHEEYTGRRIGATGILLPFRPGYFPVDARHRIVEVLPGTVSLVLVGRKKRVWGFWVPAPDGHLFVDYRDALGLRPNEGVQGDGIRVDTVPCWCGEKHPAGVWHDPTHGRIDRDIQDKVAERYGPDLSLAQKVAIEGTLQNRRDRGQSI